MAVIAILALLALVGVLLFAGRMKSWPAGVKQLWQDALSGCKMYPVTTAAAVGATVVSIMLVLGWKETQHAGRILGLLVVSIPLSYAAVCLGFFFKAARLAPHLLGCLICLGFAVLAFDTTNSAFLYYIFLYGLAALLLIASVQQSPAEGNVGYWTANQTIFSLLVLAIIIGVTLGAGLSIIFFSVAYLFDLSLSHKVYGVFWSICGLLIPSLVFLGFAARIRKQDLPVEPFFPAALLLLKDFVAIPVILVYTAILYLYGLRIILALQLPKGMVGWMVSSYAIIGLVAWLWSYFPESRITRLAMLFHRLFFPLLIPLLILLAFAAGERIVQYGVTEERYFLLLIALWLFVLAAYFSLSRTATLRVVPTLLLVFVIASSFGPWSAFSVSKRSQLSRWSNHLAAMGVKAPEYKAVSTADASRQQELSGICDYLIELHGTRVMLEYFGGNERISAAIEKKENEKDRFPDSFQTRSCKSLLNALGLRYFRPYESVQGQSFQSSTTFYQRQLHDVRGYDYLLQSVDQYSEYPQLLPGSDVRLQDKDGKLLFFEVRDAPIAELDYGDELLRIVSAIAAGGGNHDNLSEDAMTFEMETPRVKAKFRCSYIALTKDTPPRIRTKSCSVLCRINSGR